jgi:hypothetical protein
MKSGNLNLLEPSGPLQAYNGIALPFYKDKLQIIPVNNLNKYLQYGASGTE